MFSRGQYFQRSSIIVISILLWVYEMWDTLILSWVVVDRAVAHSFLFHTLGTYIIISLACKLSPFSNHPSSARNTCRTTTLITHASHPRPISHLDWSPYKKQPPLQWPKPLEPLWVRSTMAGLPFIVSTRPICQI